MSDLPQDLGSAPTQWSAPQQPDGNRVLVIVLIVVGCLLLLAVGGCVVLGLHMAREVQRATESVSKTVVPMMDAETQKEVERLEKQLKAMPAGSPERPEIEEQLKAMREFRESLKQSPMR